MNIEYPANFMLVCSMNPCPCGNYGSPNAECTCTPVMIQKYLSKISGPLLDRIDIHIEVPAVKYQDISSTIIGDSSEQILERVLKAREIQNTRYSGSKNIFKNADMDSKSIRKFCKIDEASQNMLKMAMEKLGFSARAHDRILKVARTIADLAGEETIKVANISEAIQYRSLDRQYWK